VFYIFLKYLQENLIYALAFRGAVTTVILAFLWNCSHSQHWWFHLKANFFCD